MKKLVLSIDSDGCFSDYLGGLKKRFNFEYPTEKLPPEEFKKMSDWVGWKIWSTPFFWRDLDPLPGAIEFYESFRQYRPIVLTAVPRCYPLNSIEAITAGEEKRAWWRKQIGSEQADSPGRFIWTFSHLKHTYCKAKEEPENLYVLIDDDKNNIADWERAGGLGILHVTQEKTLNEFQRRVLPLITSEVVV
jgi:5'-nucleotidase